MECRDVRPLLGSFEHLSGAAHRSVAAHLNSCAACRDELDEPGWGLIAMTSLSMAAPPPGLTTHVLARLPESSPLALAHRRQRLRRAWRNLALGAAMLVFGSAVVGLTLLHFAGVRSETWIPSPGLPLALAAKALLDALGSPLVVIVSLTLLLGGAIWPWLKLGGAWRTFASRGAFATAALAIVLLINAAGARQNMAYVRGTAAPAAPAAGSVTSVAGDIRVRGDVAGDVVTLLGNIYLEPGAHVAGSVMSAAGVVENRGTVGGAIVAGGAGQFALASLTGATQVPLRSDMLAAVAGLLAAVVSLLLGAVLVVARPQILLVSSVNLLRHPGRACLVGLGATTGLFVLALGGSILLAASVVGVVLVPVLLLALHLPFVVGVAMIGEALGGRLSGRPTAASGLWGVGIQAGLLVALALWLPLASLLVFYVAGSLGLGAMLLTPRRRSLTLS